MKKILYKSSFHLKASSVPSTEKRLLSKSMADNKLAFVFIEVKTVKLQIIITPSINSKPQGKKTKQTLQNKIEIIDYKKYNMGKKNIQRPFLYRKQSYYLAFSF